MRKLTTLLITLLLVLSILTTACGATKEEPKDTVAETTVETVEPTQVTEITEPTEPIEIISATEETKPDENRVSKEKTSEFKASFIELVESLLDYMEIKFDADSPLIALLPDSEKIVALSNYVVYLDRLNVILEEAATLFEPYGLSEQGFTQKDLLEYMRLIDELNELAEDAFASPPNFN